MTPYGNKQGNSGVTAYETGDGYIKVRFTDSRIYTYTIATAGKTNINKMHTLARAGKGLSTYISQHVKDRYEH
jgi:hypothetical protein